MKLKIDFGEGGFQGFLLRHVEKAVLAVSCLAFVLLLWLGYRQPVYEKTPPELEQLVSQAVAHINEDSSPVIVKERTPDADFRGDVIRQRTPTEAAAYALKRPFNKPLRAQQVKRADPELYPPVQLETTAMTGPLAYRPLKGLEDKTLEDPPAGPRQSRKVRTRRRRPRRRRPAVDVYGEGEEEEEESYDEESYEEEAGDYGAGAPGQTGPIRMMPSDYVIGFRPQGAGGTIYDASGTAGASVIPVGRSFVAIKALAPFEKQLEEYERTLGNALAYSPVRDRPRYVFFNIQRADVTDYADPANDPVPDADWKTLPVNPNTAYAEAQAWAGVPGEICDPNHLDPFLSMPPPPVMFRPLDELLVHSQSPLQVSLEDIQLTPEEEAPENPLAALASQPGADLPGALPMGPGGLLPFRRPGAMDEEFEDGMEEEYDEEEDYESEYGEEDYYSGYGMSRAAAMPVVQYKLVRVFDFSVKPGRTYRYRIQLWLEDPNHPQDVRIAPPLASLSDDVLNRLDQVAQQEAKLTHLPPERQRIYWRKTDWSEPSPATTVPPPHRVFVDGVEPARYSRVSPSSEIAFESRPAKGTVEPVAWDQERAVDVTIDREVERGDVLNFVKDAEYAHPVTLVVKALEKYAFQTDYVVADLRGGQELPGGTKDKPLAEFGEYLLISPDGRLVVHDELSDADAYRRYTFTEEQAAVVEPTYGAESEMEEEYEEEFDEEGS